MKYTYDPVTKTMKQVEETKTGTSKSRTTTWYTVPDEQAQALLKFAKADGLDTSTRNLEGKAINAYIKVATQMFISERVKLEELKAVNAEATEKAKASQAPQSQNKAPVAVVVAKK